MSAIDAVIVEMNELMHENESLKKRLETLEKAAREAIAQMEAAHIYTAKNILRAALAPTPEPATKHLGYPLLSLGGGGYVSLFTAPAGKGQPVYSVYIAELHAERFVDAVNAAFHPEPAPAPEPTAGTWAAVNPNVQRWIINTLLHPAATGLFRHPISAGEERQQAARAAINLLASGMGYALSMDEPAPEPAAVKSGSVEVTPGVRLGVGAIVEPAASTPEDAGAGKGPPELCQAQAGALQCQREPGFGGRVSAPPSEPEKGEK